MNTRRMVMGASRGPVILLALAALGVGISLGCRQAKDSTSTPEVTEPTKTTSAPSRPSSYALNEPITLLERGTSAYGARVFPRGDEAVVVTPNKLYRVSPQRQAVEHPVELGYLFELLEDSIAFFRDGKLRTLSLESLRESEVVALGRQPQYLLARGPRLAWLGHDDAGVYSIQTVAAGSAEFLYASHNELSAPVLFDERVYFIEKVGKSWKLGYAPLDGSGAAFSRPHDTRRPSMLAAGPDGIYYYDGPDRGVRKASFDLTFDDVFGERTICSPLAVTSRVVCAQVGGIVEFARSGADPRIVAGETAGPIADLAVSETTAFWIADSGENRMTVRAASLPKL